MTSIPVTPITTRDPHSFVAPDVWDRQILLLTRDHPWDAVMADRCFGQAVAYLITAMEKWGQGLEIGCGPLVDIAVHGFILDTRNYRQFCATHFSGKFLEHVPEIEFKYDGTVAKTARILQENGFAVDWPLWDRDALQCSPCAPGSNCH
ncbi:glycine-rich domain-containing protein [Nocardiopsis sp. NPDC101807]|uniref:glycine-rich domain-containing protein n=1 Tax=Nocardiopsis sp. NPDC101807 TaxID=3364339 RepID=UPI003826B580